MWEVDDIAGVRYRDPRDPGQESLAIEVEPQTDPLRRLLLDFIAVQPGGRASVLELRRFALVNTVYKESQVRPVVQKMVDAGHLSSDSSSAAVRLTSNVWLPSQS